MSHTNWKFTYVVLNGGSTKLEICFPKSSSTSKLLNIKVASSQSSFIKFIDLKSGSIYSSSLNASLHPITHPISSIVYGEELGTLWKVTILPIDRAFSTTHSNLWSLDDALT